MKIHFPKVQKHTGRANDSPQKRERLPPKSERNVIKLRMFIAKMLTQSLRQTQTDRTLVILSLSKYVRWLLNLMTFAC